jgi:oligopeptide/dipeptide ABC transporter ATP-binding protein
MDTTTTRVPKPGSANQGLAEPILRVEGLEVTYYTDLGRARALDDVGFTLNSGEKLGMVGESGSGKSTLALAMMRMIKPPGRIEGGKVIVGGTDLMALDDEGMRKARLNKIAYIPQGAMNSLNPVIRIGAQMSDAIRAHVKSESKSSIEDRIAHALRSVDLDPGVARMYAHELSGGMKQRVCIAIGILLQPNVIIADEPTSALDVVTQRQVMETITRVQSEINAAVILIGHDMGLMAQAVDKVAVMYAGRLVELSTVREMFTDPKHPYSQALISSLPNLDNKGVFQGIPGLAPSLLRLPTGCAFHPRCPYGQRELQRTVRPEPVILPGGRMVACHLYSEAGQAQDRAADHAQDHAQDHAHE